ncbi:phospholipase D-like domain-containing protein [Pelotalea chapellei]|uniref:Phospholipase n=1 Tax=Pelotalea chapellei TaxID=44671 RepID=A0ABS5UCP7_9BACT|nr:phospholipase D-like domain-containing protein [Pelotalea chapellei]MBT1073420.1 phospholipase [Pelotalea chapellei]
MNILEPGINCMGIYETCTTGVIVDARDYYRAIYHAACAAERYLLFTGWQFDTEVSLLRGKDAEKAAGDVRFLHFLEQLCLSKPDLEIYILAWDFSMIFSMEREWFQDIIFNWTTSERIHFRFDNRHAVGATHHQKLVVIDGMLAFVGGMDICADRWDDRRHLFENPERADTNGPFDSYHDIQSFHTGPVVDTLVEIFKQRWINSGAEPLSLEQGNGPIPLDMEQLIPLSARQVGISRTQALTFNPQQNHILEIRNLFIKAVLSAEHFIYLENQYFSSQAVYNALIERMNDPERPRLQIVMILPSQFPLTEKLFIGRTQMKMMRSLQQVAVDSGHKLGVYSTACMKEGVRQMTFIHSKLMVVDDRFLSLGSANITNRSMGLDTELNVSWEAEPGQDELVKSITRVRTSLLAEHAGLFNRCLEQSFENTDGLVEYLNKLADDPDMRLCHYEPDPSLENTPWEDALDPVTSFVDPLEHDFEKMSSRDSIFAKGIHQLTQWVNSII